VKAIKSTLHTVKLGYYIGNNRNHLVILLAVTPSVQRPRNV